MIGRLAVASWGAHATILRITTQAHLHSAAEYCTPVWCRSTRTNLHDRPSNDALRIVKGCLKPTPP